MGSSFVLIYCVLPIVVLAYAVAALSPHVDVALSLLPAYVLMLQFFVGLLIRIEDMPGMPPRGIILCCEFVIDVPIEAPYALGYCALKHETAMFLHLRLCSHTKLQPVVCAKCRLLEMVCEAQFPNVRMERHHDKPVSK